MLVIDKLSEKSAESSIGILYIVPVDVTRPVTLKTLS